MKIISIDIGTNSTLYLVAEMDGRSLKVIERGISGNRLGAGMDGQGNLPDDLVNLNDEIFERLAELARTHEVSRAMGVGTAALRKAVNGQAIIDSAKRHGIDVKIISDNEEAELTWLGVFGDRADGEKRMLVDIGGGSTELMTGRGRQLEWSDSLPIGAVASARDYFSHDPPSKEDLAALSDYARKTFSGWSGIGGEDCALTGVAGTVTAIAALEYELADYKPDMFVGCRLSVAQVRKWRERLCKMDLQERNALHYMPKARAGSIHAGAVILEALLDTLAIESLSVSDRGLMYGLAMKMGGSASS